MCIFFSQIVNTYDKNVDFLRFLFALPSETTFESHKNIRSFQPVGSVSGVEIEG